MATNREASTSTLTVHLELGGGTELLTANKKQKKHTLRLPTHVRPNELSRDAANAAAVLDGSAAGPPTDAPKHATTMFDLMQLVCRDLIVERHGMLVETDGSIRPGILVLINDADWELEGEMEYELQDGDQICLISTLHGG